MTIYKNNLEHILDELRRVDLIVDLNYEECKQENGNGTDDFLGLYVSEDEVNTILQNLPLKEDDRPNSILEKIETVTRDINNKKAESIKQGIDLRLDALSNFFGLSRFEVDTLLISLAPELDLRYEKIYSYLQNDVSKKRPTVDLVMRLLCYSIEERFRAREFFSPAAPMIKNCLIYLTGDELPLLSKSIKLDERIINFLLGNNRVDQKIRYFSTIIQPKKNIDDIILAEDSKKMLRELIKQPLGVPLILFFNGPYGTGKKMTAEAICNELGCPLLIVDSKVLLKGGSLETLEIILREALLQRSILYFEGFDVLWKEAGVNIAGTLQELDNFPDWIFLSGEQSWEPANIFRNHGFINLAFSIPSFSLRKRLWESSLNGNTSGNADISALSNKFKFSGGQIQDAIFTARNIAMAKGDELSMDELYEGCKAQSNKNLSAFARKVIPHYSWDDIILPKDIKEQLKEICDFIKYRGKVYTDWGFDKKLSLGKGLNVLFSGPSGTGKTMASEIIARDAGLDLYKIDLSSVVSKYIGETEKNLKNIFREAETSNAILFFDEADALFGKRSEVRDSHDRYANIEINYLLQKMEEHEGIVILASNFSNNIDDAFLRRMHFKVDFILPDEKLREKIWRNIFPEQTPVEALDFSFMAKFKITGGNIKNIAIGASFLAASDSGVIKMEHIIRAARREYQKIGKLCVKGDFGGYYEMIEKVMNDG